MWRAKERRRDKMFIEVVLALCGSFLGKCARESNTAVKVYLHAYTHPVQILMGILDIYSSTYHLK